MITKEEERIRHYDTIAEQREREGKRTTYRDAALDQELDDLLRDLEDQDENDSKATEAREAIAKCAKMAESSGPTEKLHDPSAEKAKEIVDDYCFPDTDILRPTYTDLIDSELTQELSILVGTSSRHKTSMPYHEIREQYCAISLLMNERGLVPPSFRLQRPLPRRAQKANSDDTLMMRDRQVIDMHWLYCRGKRDTVPDRTFAEMFLGDEFDIDMAAVLAEKPWRAEIKAENILNLTPHEQIQMALLRTKAVAETWRNAENSMMTTIDRRLREQLVSTPSLKPHIEDFKQLWLAEKITGRDGLAAIAQMHGWLSGKAPLATTTISDKLRRMRRRTAAKGSRA